MTDDQSMWDVAGCSGAVSLQVGDRVVHVADDSAGRVVGMVPHLRSGQPSEFDRVWVDFGCGDEHLVLCWLDELRKVEDPR